MPRYVMLLKFTEQGIRSAADWGHRVTELERLMAAAGTQLIDIYIVMGGFDVVAIAEAPDDNAAAKAAIAIGKQGNLTTETLRAFTREEAERLTKEAP
jgi:uncharacterized protein with GYD domain